MKQGSYNEEIQIIVGKYRDLYQKKMGFNPVVSYPVVSQMIKKLLKEHSGMGIIRVMERYFEEEQKEGYHLPNILSAWSMNKYLPKAKLDPRLYSNAEEYNEDVY